ncbi:MAG: hypothetical protein ACOVN0_20730 [Niveispirillum sp.]|uniref:hypothetical protein n=1 Tax=Niveispirillum sp. TaxID=1917217 RepID=UPI003BA42916
MARRKDPIIPDVLLDQLLADSHAKAAFDRIGLQTAIALCPRMGLRRVNLADRVQTRKHRGRQST